MACTFKTDTFTLGMSFLSNLNPGYLQLSENEIIGTKQKSNNTPVFRSDGTHIKNCPFVLISGENNRSILTSRTCEMADIVVSFVFWIRSRFRNMIYSLSEIYSIASLCHINSMIDSSKRMSLIAFVLIRAIWSNKICTGIQHQNTGEQTTNRYSLFLFTRKVNASVSVAKLVYFEHETKYFRRKSLVFFTSRWIFISFLVSLSHYI